MKKSEEMIKLNDLDLADARETFREVGAKLGIESRKRKTPEESAAKDRTGAGTVTVQ